MRVIARKNIETYGAKHPKALAGLRHWLRVVKDSDWTTMSEAANAMSKAKSVGGGRIRYDIGGGDYRLIAAFDFEKRLVFVKFVGSHADYDRIDAATVAQF